MKTIELTRGKTAIVDDCDFQWINRYSWSANQYGYAVRTKTKADGKCGTVLMHREIMKARKGEEVDHINHDTFDNRRVNLRIVTRVQNQWNRRAQKNSKSGFRGVRCEPQTDHWVASINAGDATVRPGRFDTALEAAQAYNEAAKLLHGEFALLNDVPTIEQIIERETAFLEKRLEEARALRARLKISESGVI